MTRNAGWMNNGQVIVDCNPGFSGIVAALATDDQWWYVAGSFTNICSAAITNLARLNISSGDADSQWRPSVQGEVTILAAGNGWIYIGGAFTNVNQVGITNLARIRTDTGAVDPLWRPTPPHNLQSADIADIKVSGRVIFQARVINRVRPCLEAPENIPCLSRKRDLTLMLGRVARVKSFRSFSGEQLGWVKEDLT